MLSIEDLLDRKPGEIGGGQKQRVSLARALIRDPDVLLLDEPLSHLDAAQRAHMRTELKRLHVEDRRTTILVTHDQLEAVAMAERIAVMNLGVLQQVGTFDEIYLNPVNKFVAAFVGEPPMNIMPCQPVAQGDDLYLTSVQANFRLKLSPKLRSAVLGKKAQKIDLGIRPIHIEVARAPRGNGLLELPAIVHTYESLGEEGQLVTRVGDTEVLAITSPADTYSPLEAVWLELKTEHTHLFDSESGISLLH
jgi:multiple sugar transport system ATP-binding protein